MLLLSKNKTVINKLFYCQRLKFQLLKPTFFFFIISKKIWKSPILHPYSHTNNPTNRRKIYKMSYNFKIKMI